MLPTPCFPERNIDATYRQKTLQFQKRVEFCKSLHPGSIPGEASNIFLFKINNLKDAPAILADRACCAVLQPDSLDSQRFSGMTGESMRHKRDKESGHWIVSQLIRRNLPLF
jgi:hypothetical protein